MKTNSNFCEKVFFTKLTHKHGISLITLVITIIVVIILAAAVVMSLNNNNVLTNASSARYETDRDSMQSYLELAIQKVTLRHQGTLLLDSGEVAMDATSNVKDSKGTITWKSTDIGNLSGQIIFDKGTDTDTTFYTGYKLPVYGSETKWYVDENGKLVLQTGSRIYGANEVPNTKPNSSSGINATTISKDPQKYYGAYVNYTTTNTLSEDYKWRIFYATDTNIFLIASDYISVADLPETKNGNKPINTNTFSPKATSFINVINDYTGSASIAEDMRWFNKDYFNKGYSSTDRSMKAVAYLLDKSIWTDKFKGNGAEYVVGGPSLEMIFDSYNQFTSQSNMYQAEAISAIGYHLSYDGGTNWEYHIQDSSKYLTQGDNLYSIVNNSDTYGYWVSSPSAYTLYIIMLVYYDGHLNLNSCEAESCGFRPIICLKSDISLKEAEDGKSYQI